MSKGELIVTAITLLAFGIGGLIFYSEMEREVPQTSWWDRLWGEDHYLDIFMLKAVRGLSITFLIAGILLFLYSLTVKAKKAPEKPCKPRGK